MNLLNYGTPVHFRTERTDTHVSTFAYHEGESGHDRLRLGEQCECGVLGLNAAEPQENESPQAEAQS